MPERVDTGSVSENNTGAQLYLPADLVEHPEFPLDVDGQYHAHVTRDAVVLFDSPPVYPVRLELHRP